MNLHLSCFNFWLFLSGLRIWIRSDPDLMGSIPIPVLFDRILIQLYDK